jgi:hypothetical protein
MFLTGSALYTHASNVWTRSESAADKFQRARAFSGENFNARAL